VGVIKGCHKDIGGGIKSGSFCLAKGHRRPFQTACYPVVRHLGNSFNTLGWLLALWCLTPLPTIF